MMFGLTFALRRWGEVRWTGVLTIGFLRIYFCLELKVGESCLLLRERIGRASPGETEPVY